MNRPIKSYQYGLLLGAVILLAFVLRFYRLDYHGYHNDEVISILASRPPLPRIFWSLPAYSIHPPLFYVLLHLWMGLGEQLLTLRLLPVLIGTANIALLALLGRAIIQDWRVSLVAAAFMAVSPAQILYCQQVRMYSLLVFVVLVTTLLALWAWRKGGWLRWGATSLAVAMGFYTHFYAPFSTLALNGWAALVSWHQRHIAWGRWAGLVGAQGVGLALFLPFLPQMQENVAATKERFWLAGNTFFDWLMALAEYTNGATLILQEDAAGPLRTLAGVLALIIGVTVVIFTLIKSLRLARQFPDERETWFLLHALLWTPIVIATTISLSIKPILISRYLIGISIPLSLMMAWLVVRFWRVRVVRRLALLFGASLVVSLALLYTQPRWQNESIQVAHWLADNQQPGDAIVLTYWYAYDATAFAHPELEDTYIAPGPAYDVPFWSQRISYIDWNTPQHIQPVAHIAPRYQRIFFLQSIYNPDFAYHHEHNLAWLEQHGRLVMQRDFADGSQLSVYEIGQR
jgi:uncharacterized membrane protein